SGAFPFPGIPTPRFRFPLFPMSFPGIPTPRFRFLAFRFPLFPMPTLISHSPAETEALGEAWGREARSGLVIGLSGDLGAGKTQLVKGLARGLGVTDRVHSPTFTLVNTYSGGRLTL